MSLAARLDRLRGPQAAGVVDAPRDPDAGQSPSGPPPRESQIRRLRDALEAAEPAPGLLLRCREHSDAALAADTRELVHLPEVHQLCRPDWVYIDTETTGLSGGSGNLAFMVGLARYRGPHRLEVRQYVLGGFAAEAGLLRELLRDIGPDAVPVSYNGKCFDLPLLEGRFAMHRITQDLTSRPQLDLMYSVRRAYRDCWPDCRLQTAERRLLDLRRGNDLPGSEAPAAWHAWLRQGQARPLSRVLAHNFQDVVSLALLHRRLLSDYAGGAAGRMNHAAIGAAWYRAGRPGRARQVWERAGGRLDERGGLQLADLYRRQGDWVSAEGVWLRLQARGSHRAALALSKYYEHHRRDLHRAMDFAIHCGGEEEETRRRRLRNKIGMNLELPLSGGQMVFSPRSR